jgi:glutamate racemase
VLATEATIASDAYGRALRRLRPDLDVLSRACPLFVPLVEEGWLDKDATRLIANEYLVPLRHQDVDTLVLGCTHYPLLKPLIGDVMGRDVRLIDSAQETAAETGRVLERAGLRATGGLTGDHRFVASDAPEQFLRMGQRFLGSTIDRVETVTLG